MFLRLGTSVARARLSSALVRTTVPARFVRRMTGTKKFNWLHPDDALALVPPAPPQNLTSTPAATLDFSKWQNDTTFEHQIRLAVDQERSLRFVLHGLSTDLHWCHRQRIQWLDEWSIISSTYEFYLSRYNDWLKLS